MYKLAITMIALLLLAACGGAAVNSVTEPIDVSALPETIDVQTAAALVDHDEVVMIDVREQWEYDEGHIPGVTLIPMSEIESRFAEIPTDKEIVLTCRSGNRSGQVFNWLKENGYDNVHNMAGGILAWEAAGYEVEQ